MPKWTEYTSKDTLADNDEVMLYDATARANKRGLMSKFWDYVVDKISTAVISKLETNNKTIIGAINALNSDKTKLCIDSNISNLNDFGKDQTQMLSGIAYNSALNYMPSEEYFANVFYIPSWKKYGVQLACVPDSGNIYVRMNKDGKWDSWIKLN
jgi:hypothetical protein